MLIDDNLQEEIYKVLNQKNQKITSYPKLSAHNLDMENVEESSLRWSNTKDIPLVSIPREVDEYKNKGKQIMRGETNTYPPPLFCLLKLKIDNLRMI